MGNKQTCCVQVSPVFFVCCKSVEDQRARLALVHIIHFTIFRQTSPQQSNRKTKKIEKYRPASTDVGLKTGEGTESTNHLQHISEREPDGNCYVTRGKYR